MAHRDPFFRFSFLFFFIFFSFFFSSNSFLPLFVRFFFFFVLFLVRVARRTASAVGYARCGHRERFHREFPARWTFSRGTFSSDTLYRRILGPLSLSVIDIHHRAATSGIGHCNASTFTVRLFAFDSGYSAKHLCVSCESTGILAYRT